MANEEIQKIQAHYENESAQVKRERVDLAHKVQELASNNERIKIDSVRQINHFKAKYSEYKQKLRKANTNIATLLARIAKFDIQLQADKSEGHYNQEEGNWQQLLGQAGIEGLPHMNMHDILADNGLNEEIKKLL
jgi:seryl-tRNA synthetase